MMKEKSKIFKELEKLFFDKFNTEEEIDKWIQENSNFYSYCEDMSGDVYFIYKNHFFIANSSEKYLKEIDKEEFYEHIKDHNDVKIDYKEALKVIDFAIKNYDNLCLDIPCFKYSNFDKDIIEINFYSNEIFDNENFDGYIDSLNNFKEYLIESFKVYDYEYYLIKKILEKYDFRLEILN